MTRGQQAVLEAFQTFGRPMTDFELAVYMHHRSPLTMASSGIRTRRSELVKMGHLTAVGETRLKSGRKALIHGLTERGAA